MKFHNFLLTCLVSKKLVSIGFVWLLSTILLPAQNLKAASMNDCITELVKNGDDAMTLGQIRQKCQQKEEVSVVEKRLSQDEKHILEPFTLMAHKPNYILPIAYNTYGYDSSVYQQQFDDPSISADDIEAQFQLSIKIPLVVNLFKKNIDLFAAYTNHSFWQVYNDSSAPFRETNHEPEGWIQIRPGWKFFGFTNTVNMFGINHQSNGRGGVLSRSWNRLMANFVVERNNFVLSFKPWYRLPEDAEDDDNPDITDFMGHYEIRALYKWDEHVFQVMSRNNIESGFTKGAVEFTWSFPLGSYPYLKGYLQYFSGYGESLIDYNKYVNKIGLGFAVTDWL